MEDTKQDVMMAIKEFFHKRLRLMTGVEDTSGVDMFQSIRLVANLYDAVGSKNSPEMELSDPRWNLLLRLWMGEEIGGEQRMTPTLLSHFEQVNKNTISSLLRGLEKQGLIHRELDPLDKRLFIIKLTDNGRKLIKSVTPKRLQYYNSLLVDFSDEERTQLSELLHKLITSIIKNGGLLKGNAIPPIKNS
jgi:DNA-binding MarR family transcriptional regulator